MIQNIFSIYTAKGFTPKPKTASELAGPCPWCGGEDRFTIFQGGGKDGKGRFWCRQCGRGGDAIQFVRELEGLSFREAQQALGLDPDTFRNFPRAPHTRSAAPPTFTPKTHPLPGPAWQERAEKIVTWAKEQLRQNRKAVLWLIEKRGLQPDTIEAACLGWIPSDLFRPRSAFGLPELLKGNGQPKKVWIPAGLCIPVFAEDGRIQRLKFRLKEPKPHQPKYIPLPQEEKNTAPLVIPARNTNNLWVVVESELDAHLVAQAADREINVLGMGSASNRPDADTWAKLTTAPLVLVSLDYDEAGNKSALQWWKRNLPQGRFKHWPVPEGKDPCEAWQRGHNLTAWLAGAFRPL